MSAPRPPAEPLGGIPLGLQRLLRAARRDEAALASLLSDRGGYAESHGIALTPTERAILDTIPEPQLRRIIESLPEHDVAWAEPRDVPCGGILPDMPPPRSGPPDPTPPPSQPEVQHADTDPGPPPDGGSLLERIRRFVLGE